MPTPRRPSPCADSPAEVTIIGPDGSRSFTQEDLCQMTLIEGFGGFTCPPHLGVTGPAQYAGVPLSELLESVGGCPPGNVISLAAGDNYVMTFSPEQILNGTFATYDPETAERSFLTEMPTPVIACEREGRRLKHSDGGLRFVLLTPAPVQVVEGRYWFKHVARIEVWDATRDWSLKLSGRTESVVDTVSFAKLVAIEGNRQRWTDIQGRTWSGLSLSALIEADSDKGTSWSSVEIIGEYRSITLDSDGLTNSRDYLVANAMGENPLGDIDFPLCLVGAAVGTDQYLNQAEQFVGGIIAVRMTPK